MENKDTQNESLQHIIKQLEQMSSAVEYQSDYLKEISGKFREESFQDIDRMMREKMDKETQHATTHNAKNYIDLYTVFKLNQTHAETLKHLILTEKFIVDVLVKLNQNNKELQEKTAEDREILQTAIAKESKIIKYRLAIITISISIFVSVTIGVIGILSR